MADGTDVRNKGEEKETCHNSILRNPPPRNRGEKTKNFSLPSRKRRNEGGRPQRENLSVSYPEGKSQENSMKDPARKLGS